MGRHNFDKGCCMKRYKMAWLFPGQGAQYVGMGKTFMQAYAEVRHTFEQADDLLKRSLSKIMLEGPEDELTKTSNSQVSIYVMSVALVRVLKRLFPEMIPAATAGLSLGEYTALTAAGRLSFEEGLELVQRRGDYMNDACEERRGAMAVVMGLDAAEVEHIVRHLNLVDDLWTANFNCPGQVVISGTLRGIEAGIEAVKAKGAKRVVPLQVQGAFHSGLMASAEQRLTPHLAQVKLKESPIGLVMNVPGDFVQEASAIRHYLAQQVTHPVRWEQGVRAMQREAIDFYLEIGPGKTLAGMNKRIGLTAPTISIEMIEDLVKLEASLS